jgi:hypothetical protein
MKRKFMIVCWILLAISVAACSSRETPPQETTTAQPKPTEPPQAPAAEQRTVETPPLPKADAPKETPFDYASLTEPVLIRLDEEPRLHSPIATVVTPAPQAFTLFFREAMDRASVEQALGSRAEERAKEDESAVVPHFTFKWMNDRQLHLTVTIPEADTPDTGGRSYLLDVNGATTAAGTKLQDPPAFRALVHAPPQIWRISADGKERERIFAFDKPYFSFESLGDDNRYLLLGRFQTYCECDADYEKLYALFDMREKRLIPYAVPLTTTYMGAGTFYADKRGFFYKGPGTGEQMPTGETVVKIQTDGYVHGANFSKDHDYLIMAVGTEGQEGDFDLVIRTLATGEEQRIKQALRGGAPYSEVSSGRVPVSFEDDGRYVYFQMRDKNAYKELRYKYSWETKTVTAWTPPIPAEAWASFTSSSDGVYQLYPNGGLYKGTQHIADQPSFGYWLNGTHTVVYLEYDTQAPETSRYREQIKVYDADRQTARTIAAKLYDDTSIIGTSPDGKWIYVKSYANLNTPPRP